MNILIGADWVPTPENRELFAAGDIQALFGGKLCALLKEADFRIFNLEVPLTDTASPIEKSGPALIAPTASVAAYQAAGADLLTLANNHIFDQDGQGLDSTVLTLDTAGIAHLGTGDTAAEAAKPYVFSCDGKKSAYTPARSTSFRSSPNAAPVPIRLTRSNLPTISRRSKPNATT